MKRYRVDLHLHTCLSPCGSLEMSPATIVETALRKELHAIAVTDHNTARQCEPIRSLGQDAGLAVFRGVEVTTAEEAHCVALFDTPAALQSFQHYLDAHLPHIPNCPEKFGDQVWVSPSGEIEGEEPWWLPSALDVHVEEVGRTVAGLNGLFVAAHVERPSYSLISQLGFIEPGLPLDAVEFNNRRRFDELLARQPSVASFAAYSASDAHHPDQIGTAFSWLYVESLTFEELRLAMHREGGRYIESAL